MTGLERSAGLSTVGVDGPEWSTGLSSGDRLALGPGGKCGSHDAIGLNGLAVLGEGDGKCKGSFGRVWPEAKTVSTEVLKSKISLSSSHHLGQERTVLRSSFQKTSRETIEADTCFAVGCKRKCFGSPPWLKTSGGMVSVE